MYITNVTDYDILTLCNFTNNDNNDINIEIIIRLFTIISCGMSLICLISIKAYTIIKLLFKIKGLRNFYIQIIQLDVS